MTGKQILVAVMTGIIVTVIIRVLDRHKVVDTVADYFDPEIIFS